MHKRIVFLVAALLFSLLAVMAAIITDLHDRFFPEALGARASVRLDFSRSGLSDEEAFRQLGQLSDGLGLGLVKLVPELGGDRSGQVFVAVGSAASLPETIQRFGNQPDGRVRGPEALASYLATGTYYVTGDTAGLAAFRAWLDEHGVDQHWNDDNVRTILEWLVRQSEFGTAVTSGVALMASLALYWLAVKARGRALRVLGGVSTWRIQYEDLGGFLLPLAAAAVLCDVVAIPYVGVAHGWIFVPYYATVLLVIETAVMLMTMTLALVLASASWPSPAMLAAREPAVKNLQTGATVLRVATFALVLGAVGSAVTALRAARDAAAEQAMWNALADQVVLTFPAVAGGAFEDVMPGVGRIVQDAERRGALALSYVLTRDALGLDGQDIAPYRHLVLVNRRWLDLMWSDRSGTGVEGEGAGTTEGLVRLSPGQVPADARALLEASLPVWMRHPAGRDPFTDGMTFYRYEGTRRLPFVRIGGELVFPAAGEALIVLVPEVHRLFNDSFLTSLASSRNLLFTGLEPTRDLVAQYGLEDRVQVRYSAEEGILRAQFTAYLAALRAGSLVALAVALAVSTGIGAFITAVLNARRDFVLRLAGQSWWTVVRPRVVREGLAGVVLAVLVILVQAARNPDLGSSFSDAGYAAGAAATAILALPWFHRAAARWVFTRVGLRRL